MQGLPPFGLIVPGRPPQFNFDQVSGVQWTLTLAGCPSSFLFFLTMSEPLPAGYGLSIYATSSTVASAASSSVDGDGSGGFMFLGAVTSDKPSSLFEVPASLLPSDERGVGFAAPTLTLGVGLETEEWIANVLGDGAIGRSSGGSFDPYAPQQTVYMNQQQPQPPQTGSGSPAVYKSNNGTKYALGERMLEDFCNFISSYVKSISAATLPAVLSDILNSSSSSVPGQPATAEYIVMPANFVDSWRQRLARKMKANSGSF